MRHRLFGLVLGLGLAACTAGKEDLIAKGRAALAAKNYDEALQRFDEAVKADPDDYNALWGKAQVCGLSGAFVEQQATLQKILELKNLTPKQRDEVVVPELEKSYRTAAHNDPGKAEAFLKKAIELKPDGSGSGALAKLYMERGDSASKRGEHDAAKAAYEAVLPLRTGKKLKREAANKADLVGFLGFKKGFQPNVDKLEAELTAAGQFDKASGRFVAVAEVEATGSPKDEGFAQAAFDAARTAALSAAYDLTYKVAGKPRPAGATVPFDEPDITIDEKDWAKKDKTYRVKLSIPVDALLFQVYRFDHPRPAEAMDPAKVEPAKAEPSKAEPAPAAPASAGK